MLRIKELRLKAGADGGELSQSALGARCTPPAAQQEIQREEVKTDPEHIKLAWLIRIASGFGLHWSEMVDVSKDHNPPIARNEMEKFVLSAMRQLEGEPLAMLLRSLGGERFVKDIPPGRQRADIPSAHVEPRDERRRQRRGAAG